MCKFRAVGCHFQVSAKTFFQSDILCLFLLITADCFGAEHFPAPSFLFAHERLPCFGISVLIFNNKTLHLWFCWGILTISNSFPLYLVDKHWKVCDLNCISDSLLPSALLTWWGSCTCNYLKVVQTCKLQLLAKCTILFNNHSVIVTLWFAGQT